MHRLLGSGLPNVYLMGGFVIDGDDANRSVAYADVDGLFHAIARAIAMRTAPLSAAELRFMRKRLGMTQEQIGAFGDKTNQIAAMWEKGTRPVPTAEGNLIRLAWLERFEKRSLGAAIRGFQQDRSASEPCDYVFRFVEGQGWVEDLELAKKIAQTHVELC